MQKTRLFIGLDMGKLSFAAAVCHETTPHCYAEQQFSNDGSGYLKFLKWIDKLYPGQSGMICLEHTGYYSRGICFYLLERARAYCIVPGLQIKRSLGIRRGKSDKSDARDICKYAMLHKDHLKQTTLPQRLILRVKDMLSERDRMVKAKNSLGVPVKEKQSVWVKTDKTDGQYSKAMVKRLSQAIKALDKDILDLIRSDEKMKQYHQLLCSIPGIGSQIAAQLLVTTYCFTRFENSRKLACYAGIAPFEYSSGTSIRGRKKVSHLADKNLKRLLTMAVLNTMRYDKEMRLYCERKTQEGKPTRVIINAMKNKVLARAFAVIKRGTPFVPMATYAN